MKTRRGVVGLVAVVVCIGLIQAWTMAGGDPISHVVSDFPPMLTFLLGVAVGALAAHWFWPAWACWPVLHRLILSWGDPIKWARDPAVCWSRFHRLWDIATGRKW